MQIEFTQKAYLALEQIADYVFQQSQSKKITATYLKNIKLYIVDILSDFPKAGRPAEEFGSGVRKLVYQRYSILYKLIDDKIIILTLYRKNIPDI